MRTGIPALTASIAAGLVLCIAAPAQQANQPAASLLVNQNAAGPLPLQAILGRLDPNLITVDGPANAGFVLIQGASGPGQTIPGLGTVHVDLAQPFGLASASLDGSGHFGLFLNPGEIMAIPHGTQFTMQVATIDSSAPLGLALSAATDCTVVHSWATAPTVSNATGTTARMEGPAWAVTFNTVTMGNVTFSTNAMTEYENVTSLAQIGIGNWVVVEGHAAGSGFVAEHVEVTSPETHARLRGLVESVGPSGFSMLGVSLYASTGTTFDDDGTPSSLANLMDGTLAEIRIPVGVMFPALTSVDMNLPDEMEPEPEPEPEPQPEDPPLGYFWVF